MDSVYIVIIELKNTKKIFVIVENIKQSKIEELKTFLNPKGYIVFNSNSLKQITGDNVYKKFLKKGLFATYNKQRAEQSRTSIQRLVACLYDDVKGFDIHHINKDKENNQINNLVPLDSYTNKKIDNYPYKKMVKFGKEEHDKWFNKINKPKRNSLASNPCLQLEIIEYLINHSSKEALMIFKNKISNIKTIREIDNFFYYKTEVLKEIKQR